MRHFAVLMITWLLMLPGHAIASQCYAFVENLRRDLPGVQYAHLATTQTDAALPAASVAPT